MFELAKWTEKIPESEIRRLLRYSPKWYFAGGKPGVLALKALKEIIDELSQELSLRIKKSGEFSSSWLFDYGPTGGWPDLRRVLAERLRQKENVNLDPQEGWQDVIITTGSQQTLYSFLDVLTNPGDLAIVTRPSYLGFLGPAAKLGIDLISVPSDQGGIIPEAVEKACELCMRELKRLPKILYVIPYSDNPQGKTLSEKRKQQLWDMAEEWDLLIAEDMAYKEIRFDRSTDLHPIKEFDKNNNRVVYMSTTTKESGSLRLGYSVFPAPIREQIVKAKGYFDLCSPSITQAIAKIYYEKYIDLVLPQVVQYYQKRALAMKKAIDENFPSGIRSDPQGGFFIWFDLAEEDFNTQKFVNTALKNDVLYVPGYAFFPLTGYAISNECTQILPQIRKKNGMRLCYSLSTEEEINEGIACLGKILSTALSERTFRSDFRFPFLQAV
ncbi:MAG: PLP-dependent aminotransferase family protein [Candidatus Hodarchaeota archaeon]